ncbi:tail fiber domain-containing protein [Porphyromonas circumdentaria]|uniref:tail fiber domain-containing protein n=1 Tax=Porphyromonas circumdentaria TaxID=29524 RepID=UPI0026DAFDC4|nr:tail fiber domain-containing protein [Porphyromonas circumdentaria]MDO4721706.1 tail fiber domain-containing protein [Porphyromonas circumdentaria]
MKKHFILPLIALLSTVSYNGFSQLKVTTDGQVKVDAGRGLPHQSATIEINDSGDSSDAGTALTLFNKNAKKNNYLSIDFSSVITGQTSPQEFADMRVRFLDRNKETLTSSFYLGTYTRGKYRTIISSCPAPGESNRPIVIIGQGLSGGMDFTPISSVVGHTSQFPPHDTESIMYDISKKGVCFDDSGEGEATMRPQDSGYGYIGTADKKWNKLYVNYAHFKDHPTITSDERAKDNIEPIANSVINKLESLRPVSYNLKASTSETNTPKTMSSTSTEEEQVIAMHMAAEAKRASKKQYGFVAQEFAEIFPELVEYNEKTDEYSIQYTALIPLLVEGLQELKMENQRLTEQLSQLSSSVLDKNNNIENDPTLNNRPVLYGNRPNPFATTTEFFYFIPESSTDAYIAVLDMQGKMIETLPCKERGVKGKISYSAHNLADGLYLYSLIVDNEEIATKKMIVKK